MVNKYYQKHKERLMKDMHMKDIKIFLKKEKTSVIDTKIFQKNKSRNYLSK